MVNQKLLLQINNIWFDFLPHPSIPPINSNSKFLQAEENAYEETIHALKYIDKADWQNCQKYFERARALTPNSPICLYNCGWVSAKLKNYANAVDFFNKSLLKKKDFLHSHVALGIILSLEKSYYKADKHLNTCLSLMPNLQSLDLFLMSNSYHQNKLPNYCFDFSYPIKTQQDIDFSSLAKLETVINEEILSSEKPIIFCSSHLNTFHNDLLPMIFAIIKSGTKCNFHIHLYNCSKAEFAIIEKLGSLFSEYIFAYSFENHEIDVSNPHQKFNYYASMRFVRLLQLMDYYKNQKIIMLENNLLVIKDLSNLGDKNSNIDLIYIEHEPMWNATPASILALSYSSDSLSFLKQISGFIINNLIHRLSHYSPDSVGIYLSYELMKKKNCFTLIDPNLYLNSEYDQNAIIWSKPNYQADKDNPYTKLKSDLMREYLPIVTQEAQTVPCLI